MFLHVPASAFSPFSPFLPSRPSLPGMPTFPSAPGGPTGPALPGGPGDPGTLQTRRGAPFALVSNSWPKTAWHKQTTPINAHILGSVDANSETQARLAGSQRCSVEDLVAPRGKNRQLQTKQYPFVDHFPVRQSHDDVNCCFFNVTLLFHFSGFLHVS